jgi:hypothetical protein
MAMTITVELKPEVQAELARQAIESGEALEARAAKLLEQAVLPEGPTSDAQTATPKRSLEDVFAAVRGLADDLDFSRNPSMNRPLDLS